MHRFISCIRYCPPWNTAGCLAAKDGVDETALTWFKLYLRPRSAKGLVGEEFSKLTNLSISVPQSSICGPVLYTAYASTLSGSISDCDLDILGYADHSLYDSFDPGVIENEQMVLGKLESSLKSVNQWMNQNWLKMNNDKTEFLLVVSRHQLLKCESNSVNVCDVTVTKSAHLGVYTDS